MILRYFFSDPYGDGFQLFATAAERDASAAQTLAAYRQEAKVDGWPVAVLALCCGIVTHAAQEVDRVERVGALDDNGEDEDGEAWDEEEAAYHCDVALLPLPSEEPRS